MVNRYVLGIIGLLLASFSYAQDTLLTSQYASELEQLNNNTLGTFGEVSIKNLNILTGNMPNILERSVNTNYPVATLINLGNFKIFTTLMFVIAVGIASITIIDVVTRTALEGEFMGRKHPKFFLLLRSIVGVVLFLPTADGYTVLQIFMNNIALQGIALANTAWASLAATMLMYNGGIGSAMIANSNISASFGQQYVDEQVANITNDLAKIESDELEKLIYINNVDADKKSEALHINATSMYCLQNAIYASGIEDPSQIQATFNSTINKMFNSIMIAPSNTTSYSYKYQNQSGKVTDCGTYTVTFNSNMTSGLRAMFIEGLRTLSSQYILFTKKSNQNDIPSSDYDKLANSMINIAMQWAYQLTLITADMNSKSIASQSGMDKPTMADIIDGGWAMLANNYTFYTRKLNEYGIKSSRANTSTKMSTPRNLIAISYNSGEVGDRGSQYDTFSDRVKNSTNTEYNERTKKLNFNTTSTSTNQNYCQATGNCSNIDQYIFKYSGNTPVIGSATKSLYASFKKQIPNPNHVKTFREIGKEVSICAVPFTAPENCSSTAPSGGGMGAVDFGTTIGLLFAGIALITLGASVAFFKVAGVAIFASMAIPYAGVAFVSNFTDLTAIFSNPNELYPKSLAWDIQSYTYFIVKAWYDTFIMNQTQMFINPVRALSMFGMRVMSYSISFIIRIGSDTFASIVSTAFDLLFRRVYLEIALGLANMYAGMMSEWGYRYFTSHAGNGLAFSIWQVSWFLGMFRYPGIPMPAPPGIMCNFLNYLCIPFIFPIIIPMHLIIGGIVMGIGIGLHVVKLAATVAKLFDVTDMLLQAKNFITTRYNPVYFGIAVPMIVMSATFAIIIPIYPIMIYTLCVLSYYVLYIEAIIAAPLILIGILFPDGHAVLGKADKLLQLLVLVYIRPFMTVMGFVIANILASIAVIMIYETAIPMLNAQVGAWAHGYVMVKSAGGGSNETSTMITAIVTILAMFMFIYMYYQVIIYSYALTYKVPYAVNKYLAIPMSGSEQEEVARMEEIAENFKEMTRNLASAGTDSASKSEEAAGAINPVSLQKETSSNIKSDQDTSSESGSIGGRDEVS